MADETIAVVLPLDTPDQKRSALRVALSMYLGEGCRFCEGTFDTLESLDSAVFAGYHARGRLAHKACWEAQTPEELARIREQIEQGRRR